MSGKIQVDAKQMSMAFASVIDSLIETSLITIRPIVLTSIKRVRLENSHINGNSV